MNGWVKLWREITDHPVFADGELLRLFLWLICKAAREDTTVRHQFGRGSRVFQIGRGELIAGRTTIADALDWPKSTVRNRLIKLMQLGCIKMSEDKQKPLISIENYDHYQQIGIKHGQAKDKQKDKQTGQAIQCNKTNKTPAENANGVTDKDKQKKQKVDREKYIKKEQELPPTPQGESVARGDARNLELPQDLKSPEFAIAWKNYLDWILAVDGKQLNAITGQLRLSELLKREAVSPGKAVADLKLTMSQANRTGTIWDSSRSSFQGRTKQETKQTAEEIYGR